jgi:hypothetical protein
MLAYYASRVLAATTFDLLDLSGSLTDAFGTVIAATKLKLAVVSVSAPDGAKKLRVGPQGQSNVIPGPWGGVGATVYKEVTHWSLVAWEPVAGFSVVGGTSDIFPIYNPTASPVTYSVLLAGL